MSEQDNEVGTLVVVSKVKKHIKNTAGLKTSQCAIEALSQKIVEECIRGAENAKADGRLTMKGRDIQAPS